MKGGLIFFLGNKKKGTVSKGVIETMTVVLVGANSIFLFVSIVIFAREYRNDRKHAEHKRATGFVSIKKEKSQIQGKTKNSTQVLPLYGSDQDRRTAAAERAWGKSPKD